MGASYVVIANLALGHLGDSATVASLDPPEGSPQAEHCAQFLPVARDVLLEMHAWNFAKRRVRPALVSADQVGPWRYTYALPGDSLKVLAVLPDTYCDETNDAQPFDMEIGASDEPLIVTNVENPVLTYIKQVNDPTRFSPLFVEALAWLLASYIAGPMIKGDAGQAASQAAWAAFLQMYGRATGSSANQAKAELHHRAPWMLARG